MMEKKIQSKQFSIEPGLNTSENLKTVGMINPFNLNESTRTVSFTSEQIFFSEAGFQTVEYGPESMGS